MRSSRAEKLSLQQELEDARQMQLRLLPERSPAIKGLDLAGFSKPAREVGGDFFDYLLLADGKIGIALADVSGKGLKAAMNAVLTNGMLHEVAQMQTSCGRILAALNLSLYPRMEKQMFTALELAILDVNAKILKWANAAQPYPIIKQNGQISELQREGGLPLGIMRDVEYPDWEFELQTGDIVIFYTDGLIEAENEAEEMYSTQRLLQVVTEMKAQLSAQEMIEAIWQDITDFVGNTEQYDDMTVVVAKIQ
jgi:sigma-B regulation protein RsbU (phosphoserine phosphatase)